MAHQAADPQEAADFLAANPDLVAVDLLLPDQHGVMRGKRIPAHDLVKVYESGIFLPGSVFALDINGNTVESTNIGFATGDCDQPCRPLSNTLVPVPWQKNPMAQCLLTMEQVPGEPFFANPRHVLDRILERFKALALTPVVAIELEFYLTDPERQTNGQLQAPISPVHGGRETDTQVYSMDNLDDYGELLEAIMAAAKVQGIPASAAIAEYAPGQFEINLQHVDNPLLACDQALMLKRLIRAVARQYGYEATFMAKPFAEQAGNGMHIHMSLLDAKGNNIFAAGTAQSNKYLRQALAGLQHTMADMMGILCPKVNSLRRFQPDFFVPMAPTWGIDNRTVALRIPNGAATGRRIEHRVAGADANPYLAMSSLLAGTHYGLTKQLTLAAPIKGNAPEQVQPSLPLDWHSAQSKLAQSGFAETYLGADFLHVYQAVQEAEYKQFNNQVTSLEIDWYQRTL
ncbi:MAG: glutamine synthetase family protein [Gammaproteobacteria bacterium]|jgi:glutamine synthetase|nr:glutamine synthetase family protein [Gammaproteobacteria bacterium]